MSPFLKSRYTSLLLVVLIALFLMQRGGLLLWGYSHIAHPGFDETASGVLTCDLLDGEMRAPLFTYQYESRSGDGLIEGFLLVPFFKFFGRSLFSLKMLALLSALLSLLCWIFFIKRYQGMWAAIIFTALFAFPPLMFSRLNLMGTIASHHLINPLMAVQLLFLFRILEGGNTRGALWLWVGFGFLSGLGAYTFYTYIIFASFCLLFLLIFRSGTINVPRVLLFLAGFCSGFSPWIVRYLSSPAGKGYLVSLLKTSGIGVRSFIQNFCFSLPHSLGYHYPSREIGIVGFLFIFFMLLLSGMIVREVLHHWRSQGTGLLRERLASLSPATLQGIALVLFPLFFLACISLAPMKIRPFEYWPSIGLFGNFGVADVYRYRWLHPLFPFYGAICAVGIATFFKAHPNRLLSRGVVLCFLAFFLLWSIKGSVELYTMDDYGRVFYYKGYSYDRMGNRFLFSDVTTVDLQDAQQCALHYPRANRGEIYRCLGTKVVLEVLNDPQGDRKLEQTLKEIGLPYMRDFIYGVVRSAQNLTGEKFLPFEHVVAGKFPALFYENWGYRHLGYNYYSSLFNWEKLQESIPALEKRFFRRFLGAFRLEMEAGERGVSELLDQIGRLPASYQADAVRGVGLLVGAEMLFDPLYAIDYPLDSRFGERLSSDFKGAFYEGVGSGFAETLCRFLRKLVLPEDQDAPLYEKILDMEWERCQNLMNRVSPQHSAQITRGFVRELQRRSFDEGVRTYLNKKL